MRKSTGNFPRYMWLKVSLKVLILYWGFLFACLPSKKAILPPPPPLLKAPSPSREVKEVKEEGQTVLQKARKAYEEGRFEEALLYYKSLEKDLEARKEALSAIASLKVEELKKVSERFKGHTFGVYATLMLSKKLMAQKRWEEVKTLLKAVRAEAQKNGFGEVWESLWEEFLKESGRRLRVSLILPFSEKEIEKREAFLRGCFLAAGIFGPERASYRVTFLVGDKAAEYVIDPIASKRSLEQKQMKRLIETAVKEGIKEVGILYPSSSSGERDMIFLKKVLFESGLNVSFTKSYPPETTDFSSVLREIKQFPQALWVTEGDKVCLIASHLAFLEKAGTRILAPEVDDPKGILSSCGRYLEGALLGCSFYKESSRQEVRAFREDYKKTYAQDPDLWAFLGYKSVYAILEGDEKLDSPFILKIQGGRLKEIL